VRAGLIHASVLGPNIRAATLRHEARDRARAIHRRFPRVPHPKREPLPQLAFAPVLLCFALGASNPVRRLASIRVCVPVFLRIAAQAERLAPFSQLAPEVPFSFFPEDGRALHHDPIVDTGTLNRSSGDPGSRA
jgi:hypothetical protein